MTRTLQMERPFSRKVLLVVLTLLVVLLTSAPRQARCDNGVPPVLLLSDGIKAYENGQFSDAIVYFESFLKEKSDVRDHGLYYLGEALVREGRFDEALLRFDEIITGNPESLRWVTAHERAGDVNLVLKRYDKALTYYRTPLLRKGKGVARVIYKVSLAHAGAGREDEGATFQKTLLVNYPRTLFGEIVENGEGTAEVLKRRPFTSAELEKRGRHLIRARRYNDVIEEVTAFLEGDREGRGTIGLSVLLANATYGKRHYGEALRRYRQVLGEAEEESVQTEALYGLIRCYLRTGKEELARREISSFITLFPASSYRAPLLLEYAGISLNEGAHDRGTALLRQVAEEYAASPHGEKAAWRLSRYYYREGLYAKAVDTLKLLEGYSSSRERALYWQAKAERRLGKADAAAATLRRLSGEGINYYAFRAVEELAAEGGGDASGAHPLAMMREGMHAAPLDRGENPLFDKVRLLLSAGIKEASLLELKRTNPWKHPRESSILYGMAGHSSKAISLSMGQIMNGSPDLVSLAFPSDYGDLIGSAADAYGVDPHLIRAVIMQESRFNPDSYSHVGAMGLMQIMGATGEDIAERIGDNREFKPHNLFHPPTNIHFGAWYLRWLLKIFDGTVPHALAAYNAGPGKAREWVERGRGGEMDDFIEDISYRETRGYVKKVLAYYYAYRILNGE